MIEERRLDRLTHDLAGFDSGVPALNEYLVRFARQDEKRNVSRVYVLVDSARPRQIIAFYALCAAQVDATQLPDELRKKLPRYPVPCIRIGRLAVHVAQQGRGLGRIALGKAMIRCLTVRESVGIHAVIVDAKDERAARFYEHFGFTRLTVETRTLSLPL